MEKCYLWEISYQIKEEFAPKERNVRIITKENDYQVAKNSAVKRINEKHLGTDFETFGVIAVNPLEVAYLDGDAK